MTSMQIDPNNLINPHSESQQRSSLFPQGSNLLIAGGHFLSVQGDYHHNVYHHNGLHGLSQNIASGAMFNSAQRFPPGKCHPGTREKAIETIKTWILDPSTYHGVVWLYGPAGSGKSAIAQSICELLWELYRDRYGGSFFFATGDTMGRGDGSKLFSTLAYQLAIQFPPLRLFIEDALTNDPALPTKSMDIQLKSLIVDPISQAQEWPTHSPTIIIDGLDECTDSSIQKNIIYLISHSIRYHKLPLRFLIASRPEYWIRNSFEIGTIGPLTLRLSLNEVGDADRDIEAYLVSEFDKIYNKFSRVMSTVEQPWPEERIIDRFVEEASGQFIHASTIIKFIGHSSDFSDPRDRLHMITTAGPHHATAFSNLDSLYAAILSRVPDSHQSTMSLLLGGAILKIPVQAIEIFLTVDPGKVTLVVDALSSLIEVVENEFVPDPCLEAIYGLRCFPDTRQVHFHHLSFREFLQDKLRSGQYFVDVPQISYQFWCIFLKLIGDALEQKPEVQQHQTYIMNLKCLSHLLRGIETFFNESCNVSGTAVANFVGEPYSKIKAFNISDSTSMEYCSYLLRILSFLRDRSRDSINLLGLDPFERIYHAQNVVARRLFDFCHKHQKVPPILFYAEEVEFNIDQCPSLPDVDIFQDIQHCLLDIHWYPEPFATDREPRVARICSMYLVDDVMNITDEIVEPWLTSWLSQKMKFMCHCLTLVAYDAVQFSKYPQGKRTATFSDFGVELRRLILGSFLIKMEFLEEQCQSHTIGNVHGKLFLTLLSDSRLWHALRTRMTSLHDWKFTRFTLLIMKWMNNLLLRGPTLSIITQLDETLPSQTEHTINMLYERYFLPRLESSRVLTELMVARYGEYIVLHVKLAPYSGASSTYILEEEKTNPPKGHREDFHYIQDFQKRFFSSKSEISFPLDRPTVDRTRWYPYLASYLLNDEVKNYYRQLYTSSVYFGCGPCTREFLHKYFVECLSYAYPSERNLASLRALRILVPQVITPWYYLPKGFCAAVVGLLQKYDRSSLPIEELNDFRGWLAAIVENKEKDNLNDRSDI